MSDRYWMEQAYQQALKAIAADEVPVGAIVVVDDQIIGEAFNQVRQLHDPTAHAEMLAIRRAGQAFQNHRLPKNSTLYVTLEPCAMCAGAMVLARLSRLVFACRDVKAGAAGSVYNLLQGYPLNHQVQIDEGFLQNECSHLLSDFFATKR